MDTQKRLHENISALADGELPQGEQELAFAALGTADGQAAWRAYHLTGAVLRDQASGALSAGFEARLAARLAFETIHDMPPPVSGHSEAPLPPFDTPHGQDIPNADVILP